MEITPPLGWRGDEPLDDKAEAARVALEEKTPGLTEVFEAVPLSRTLAEITTYDPTLGYSQLKARLRRLSQMLEARFGEQLAIRYGLALLADLIHNHERRWREHPLDSELKPEFVDSFHRILSAIARGGVLALKPDTDAYAKELAICLHRLIPAGGQMIDPGSGVPRRTFFRVPTLETVKAAFYVLFNAKGRVPFAEFHTNLFQRRWFTADGWEYSFRLMPSVFRAYPELKGLMGASWFFDPQLQKISPGLSFVREVPLRWGAVMVHVQRDADPDSSALTLSKERRELFERGKYVPNVYAFFLSKKDILAHISTRQAG